MAEAKKDKRDSLPAISPTAAIFLGIGAARTLAQGGETRPMQAFQKADALRRKGASEVAIYAATNKILDATPYAGGDAKAPVRTPEAGRVEGLTKAVAKPAAPRAPTVATLRAEAKSAGIKGASKMTKASLMEALGKNVNRIGVVGMIAAPVAAALVAYDATKSSAHASGTDSRTASMQAATAAVVAGGVTAGVGYGIGKGIGYAFKAASAIAPRAAPFLGPVGIGLGLGFMGYGAYKGYQAHGIKGAALGVVGADSVLEIGKAAPATTPDAATPRGLDAIEARQFEAANTAYDAMQEAERNVVKVNTFARERHTDTGTVVKEIVKAHTRARPQQ